MTWITVVTDRDQHSTRSFVRGASHWIASLLLMVGYCLAPLTASAQFYTWSNYWTVDAGCGITPQFLAISNLPEQAGTYTPRHTSIVYSGSPCSWSQVDYSITSGPPGGSLVIGTPSTNGATNCNSTTNGSPCLQRVSPALETRGVYQVTATVTPGGATANQIYVVGGGSALAATGPQQFVISNPFPSTGTPFSLGITVGSLADPTTAGAMVFVPAVPGTATPAALATAIVNAVNGAAFGGYPVGAFAATSTIPGEFTISAPATVPPALPLPFRFWIGDGALAPICQVTGRPSGRACQFNPMIWDANAPPVPTLSEWGVMILGLLLAIALTLVWGRAEGARIFVGDSTAAAVAPPPLVEARLVAKLMGAVMTVAMLGLAIAAGMGIALAVRDIVGTLLSASLVAYLLHLWIAMAHEGDD